MNKRILTTLTAGLLSLNIQAGFEQFNDPVGAMNVFSLTGTYQYTITPFGVPELRALTSDNRTFELLPNVNLYADNPGSSDWRNNGGAGPDGAKIVEASTLFEINDITSDLGTVYFQFTIDAYDLDSRYDLVGFVKILDQLSGSYATLASQSFSVTGTGISPLLRVNARGYTGQLLQAGWALKGINANPEDDWGSATVTATTLYVESSDISAPIPDPMTFASVPTALSDSAIKMTASTASDAIYGVQYLFTNTVNNTSSGWQSSTNYTETGLNANTTYFYQVKARDTGANANETDWSAALSAKTSSEDTTPPAPGQMSFAAADFGATIIKLTADTASDPSGVEYYFECVAGDGNDSGWQDSPVYYDTGLAPGSSFGYTVIARDKSAAANSNTVSTVTNLTTMPVESDVFNNPLTGYAGNTDNLDVVLELNKVGLETGSTHPDAIIEFDTSGATFGDGLGFTGRDLLRTIATGYQDVSFEAYATLTFSGATDLSGFIGIGQGLQIGSAPNFGVPELNLSGVNGVAAQFKDNTAGSGTFKCNLFKFVSGNPGGEFGEELLSDPVGSTETIRARLIYDAVAETVNVAFDKNYAGGAFSPDQDMGTVSTALSPTNSMWDGAPVRVYVGGGEGTIVKDFEIVVTRAAQPPFTIQINDVVEGGGLALSWDGALGRIYELQYSTNLVTGSWITDTSYGGSGILSDGGSVSITSTVSDAAIYYRVLSQ